MNNNNNNYSISNEINKIDIIIPTMNDFSEEDSLSLLSDYDCFMSYNNDNDKSNKNTPYKKSDNNNNNESINIKTIKKQQQQQ